jgi:hypothetical protein
MQELITPLNRAAAKVALAAGMAAQTAMVR